MLVMRIPHEAGLMGRPTTEEAEARTRAALGKALKDLREAAGMSQIELALKAGMNQTDLSRMESGMFWGPIPVWMRLCKALDTGFAEVLAIALKPGKGSLAVLDDETRDLLRLWVQLNPEGRRVLMESARAARKLYPR